MSWVRFWFKVNCSSGNSDEESNYEWYDRPLDPILHEEELRDSAEENVPSWATHSERGFKYGWEIVDAPPFSVVQKQIARYEQAKKSADEMIEILTISSIMGR